MRMIGLVLALSVTLSDTARAENRVSFSRDVLPILSANCFACHGPDAAHRKANLRLDVEASAKQARDGAAAIVPSKPELSSLVARLLSTDPDEVMPPPEANKKLKPEQIAVLKRWIAEGAVWGKHWSFEPVVKPTSSIDQLVDVELAKRNLKRQPRASVATLVRRLHLDLTGLPPTKTPPETLSAAEYTQLVDELLASKAYGEHWARMWLDLARYADTKGYEKDLGRNVWPWRDWVVNALNADMPLDQFTLEQLAGDLLPQPTEQQLIATAFHRNTMVNDEGGTDDEEFRIAAVKDRVDTTLQVWMGLTMGCAKCHSHKYDPITQEDYYRTFAIFNQTEDADRSDEEPKLAVPTAQQAEALAAASSQVQKLRELLSKSSGIDLQSKDLETSKPEDAPDVAKLKAQLKGARQAEKSTRDGIIAIPIFRELPLAKQRVTKIHNRGNFLDQTTPVTAALPSAFGAIPEGTKVDRAAFARWLVSRDNVLTPRVWANRIWARLFGMGLVETEEDFGALGSAPSHPELLDLLAASYRDDGWSLKKLIRSIVMSETYKQSSASNAALRELDPRNMWLARGGRYRLSAEVVRDQALAVSRLLSQKMGGPPVMPPQPDGLWRSTYNTRSWINAEGEDRHRRGLYTYLKRTTPYPSFITFDGGSGEVCQIRRIRTNTPLQALVTLNDPVYLEASAALAQKMIAAGSAPASQGLSRALCRPVLAHEAAPLLTLWTNTKAEFQEQPKQASEFIRHTRGQIPTGMTEPDFAAWIVTANAILNLDEFLTRN